MFSKLVDIYPDSQLADDALCELGRLHMFSENWKDISIPYFNRVIEEYPNSNAVDNAINWIAWRYLQDKDYVRSLDYYRRLTADFARNRLGKRAIRTQQKIEYVIEKSVQQAGIKGVEVTDSFASGGARVIHVAQGSSAGKNGLKWGDIIVRIDGFEVTSTKSYFNLLSQYSRNDQVELNIQRRNVNIKQLHTLDTLTVYPTHYSDVR